VIPSGALARAVVGELVRGGVRDAVLCPGSRSAPLALALHAADASGALRLHVRLDERGAGYLALGLAKASGRPVPVVCTSGTAVANLHPAVLEAHHSGVALLALTADRPAELRGVAANQTTDQPGLFGSAVRQSVELPAPAMRVGDVAAWRSTVARAVAAARGSVTGDPGPVHVDVALREPLLPPAAPGPDDGEAREAWEAWLEPLDPRAGPWLGAPPSARVVAEPVPLDRGVPTVVVAGDGAGAAAGELAADAGWPLLAEPSSGCWGPPAVVAAPLVAGCGGFLADHAPARVVVTGHPTLSRPVLALLDGPDVEVVVVGHGARWPDPTRRARVLATDVTLHGDRVAGWAEAWQAAGRRVRDAVGAVLEAEPEVTEPRLARDVLAALPTGATLLLGSSQPIRDVHLAADPRADLRVLANRGLSGIDGLVSTATGVALASPGSPTYALLGDLSLLHDATGLVVGPDEPAPDLCVLVVDNDGGGIFGLLEPGAPEHAHAFERVFGTPHGVDLGALCAATGVGYQDVDGSPGSLAAAVRPVAGRRVVHVRTDRTRARDLHARLRAAAAAALG
jgi:2-succinyl-5-enolpyruvyl-6-hydroxy-3-cyclohexene-1-carboxylate synthase